MTPEPGEPGETDQSDRRHQSARPDAPTQSSDWTGTEGTGREGTRPEGDRGSDTPVGADRLHAGADEEALLAAFDRLSPQGSLRWGFDDAMRRIANPESDVAAPAWPGLPLDLWERGQSARIGRRFVGDVAGVMAELLANDARAVAAAASAGVNVATWDALRYLAARVDALEAATDPFRLEAAELPLDPPDLGAAATMVGSLVGSPDPDRALVVGESGDDTLPQWLRQSGWRVESVEPRAASAWAGFAADGESVDADRAGRNRADRDRAGRDRVDRDRVDRDRVDRDRVDRDRVGGDRVDGDRVHRDRVHRDRGGGTIVMAEVLDHLRTVPPDARASTVLAGCVDRLGLAAKAELLVEAIRVTRPGGVVIVLATDQAVWDAALEPPARDLAAGRPLHPETWSLLFRRSGLVEVDTHGPGSGALHAVVGRLGP